MERIVLEAKYVISEEGETLELSMNGTVFEAIGGVVRILGEIYSETRKKSPETAEGIRRMFVAGGTPIDVAFAANDAERQERMLLAIAEMLCPEGDK